MTRQAKKKEKVVESILSNNLYTVDSVLRQRLKNRLLLLSQDNLDNLKMIVDRRLQDARSEAVAEWRKNNAETPC